MDSLLGVYMLFTYYSPINDYKNYTVHSSVDSKDSYRAWVPI